jgi:hypothetical protein
MQKRSQRNLLHKSFAPMSVGEPLVLDTRPPASETAPMATVALVVAIVSLVISAATLWLRYREHGWEAVDHLHLEEERSAHATFELELLALGALVPYNKQVLASLGFEETATSQLADNKVLTDLDQAFVVVRVRVTNTGSAAAGLTDIKVYLPPIPCLVFWSHADGSPVPRAPKVARNTPYDAPWGREELHSLHVMANSVESVFRDGKRDLYFVFGTNISERPSDIHLWATANADGLAKDDRGFAELTIEFEYGALGTEPGVRWFDEILNEGLTRLPGRQTDEERAKYELQRDALLTRF